MKSSKEEEEVKLKSCNKLIKKKDFTATTSRCYELP
jgi:hypothetical protein